MKALDARNIILKAGGINDFRASLIRIGVSNSQAPPWIVTKGEKKQTLVGEYSSNLLRAIADWMDNPEDIEGAKI